jgi:Family of unknown function (DUF6088)
MDQSIESKILDRVYGHGRGWVFTPKYFSGLGDMRSIGMALTRLLRKGTIRRLDRGLYDYPVHHPKIGTLAPSVDALARALAGRDAIRLQPTGAYAANLLGLSDQVPMKVVFLTDGPSRHVRVGNQEIHLKRTTPRNMATAGKTSGLVIQALRFLGQKGSNSSIIQTLRHRLSAEDKAELLKDIRFAPAWVAAVIREINTAQN